MGNNTSNYPKLSKQEVREYTGITHCLICCLYVSLFLVFYYDHVILFFACFFQVALDEIKILWQYFVSIVDSSDNGIELDITPTTSVSDMRVTRR